MYLYEVFWVLIKKNLQVPKILPNSFNMKGACISSISYMFRVHHYHNTRGLLQRFEAYKVQLLQGSATAGAISHVDTPFRPQEPMHKRQSVEYKCLLRHMSSCPTSPAQAGQEDSDLSVARFLIRNSKWGWKKLHYLWTGISLRPIITILPTSNASTLLVSLHSGINGPFGTLTSACSYSHPGGLKGVALQLWLQHIKDAARQGYSTG